MQMDNVKLQKNIGYQFQNLNFLRQALTHSSYANENIRMRIESNERLEFLGDAVLELVSSEFLFRNNPDKPEGDLTKMRAAIVCETSLAHSARSIRLGEFLLLGKGELVTGGRERDSLISDGMEALIGAIYLDGGFTNAKEFIERFILSDMENKQLFYDSKTILQELVQGKHMSKITYQVIEETGPEHDKFFHVAAYIGDEKKGYGQGKTKKSAEQDAAYRTILMLRKK